MPIPTTWYNVTDELIDQLEASGSIFLWWIKKGYLGENLQFSSQEPKPGDYLKVKLAPSPYVGGMNECILWFPNPMDIIWEAGQVSGGYSSVSFGGAAPNLYDYYQWYGRGDQANEVAWVNSNLKNALPLGYIRIRSVGQETFIIRVLGRNTGNYLDTYIENYCQLIEEYPSSGYAVFNSTQIPDAFSKTSQNYFRYWSPYIKVAVQFYMWKDLTNGYIPLECVDYFPEEELPYTNEVVDFITNLFPSLNETDVTIEDYLSELMNFGQGELDESITSLVGQVSNFVESITGLPDLDIDTILGTIGQTVTSSIGGLQEIITPLLQEFTLQSGLIANSIYNNNNDILLGLKDYVQQIILGNIQSSDAITASNTQVAEHLSGVAASLERLLSSNITNPIEFASNLIQFFVDLFYSRLSEIPLGKTIFNSQFIKDSGNSIANELSKWYNGVTTGLEKLANGEIKDLNEFEGIMQEQSVNVPLFHLAQAIFSIIPVTTTLLAANLDPIGQNLRQITNAKFRPTLNEPASLIAAYYKGGITYEYLSKELAKHGLSDERIKVLLEAAIPLLSPGSIQLAYLRKLITEQQHDNNLQQYGYDNEQIALFKNLYYQLPPIQDLIRFAVREVFSPEIANKFGQYEDYPELLTDKAAEQGLSEEAAKWYWAAHWELPSAGQGFEMFQRSIIDKPTLEMLLRSLDVMPFWREKLIQLSYNPLTRVDVRRMYQLGVINREQVYRSYLDVGYSPTNAELMTQFTVTYEAVSSSDGHLEVRQLTRSVIEAAFKRGVITESEALSRLINIGYIPNDASLLINIAKYNNVVDNTPDVRLDMRNKTASLIKDSYGRRLIPKQEALSRLESLGYSQYEALQEIQMLDLAYVTKIKSVVTAYVKTAYSERTIEKNQAVAALNAFSIVGAEQDQLFAELEILKDLRDKKPTYAQFKQLLAVGIITNEQFYEEILGLGFADKYADWLYQLETGER